MTQGCVHMGCCGAVLYGPHAPDCEDCPREDKPAGGWWSPYTEQARWYDEEVQWAAEREAREHLEASS